MPPPPPPSIIESIKCPAFAIAWLGPTFYDNTSIIAYGGGGGSARTGVSNSITVMAMHNEKEVKQLDPSEPIVAPTSIRNIIDTGDQICVGIDMHHYGPKLVEKRLIAAIGMEIRLYNAISGELLASEKVDNDGVNVVAFSPGAETCVAGCENGRVLLYQISKSDENKLGFKLISTSDGHLKSDSNKKGVSSITFSPSNRFFLSSARDGTARVCDSRNGSPVAVLKCSITDPNVPPPKKSPKQGARKMPILVRGCSFGRDEQFIYTCQSGRKGAAYCSIWRLNSPPDAPPAYVEVLRKCVSPKPVSSMSISGDKSTLTLGNVEGTIFLIRADNLGLKKKFEEVHDLPVTCIAAWPSGMELPKFMAVSASADNKLAFLSTFKLPRSYKRLFLQLIFLFIMGFLFKTWYEECNHQLLQFKMDEVGVCMKHSIFAPPTRPGISFVPH